MEEVEGLGKETRIVSWWQIVSPDLLVFATAILASFAAAACRNQNNL